MTTILTAADATLRTVTNNAAPAQAKAESVLMSLSQAVATGLDPTNPDALFAFFKVQMDDARGKLSEAMQQQEVRNENCTQLQSIQGRFTEYEAAAPIAPGDPKWDAFLADTQDALKRVGPDTKEGQAIQALLTKAMPPPRGTWTSDSLDEARTVSREGGSYVINTSVPGKVQYDITAAAPATAGAPVTKDQLTSIQEQLKSRTDALQSETSMAMIRVQQYVDQCSQIVSNCSNIMRKLDEMAMAPIQNIRS
jgi:hypothetical protein